MTTALFIFRRDLRVHDNRGLLVALNEHDKVLPCFIFDPRQTTDKNTYKSESGFVFLKASLADLNEQLHQRDGRLYTFEGIAHEVVDTLLKNHDIDAVYVNRDYTPFSIARDEKIEAVCKKHKVDFKSFDDALLHPPEMIHKDDGEPYTVYTPFYKKSSQFPVSKPKENKKTNYMTTSLDEEKRFNLNMSKEAGRQGALVLLKELKQLEDYKTIRDFPAQLGTSRLSVHHKFGTISIRETYWKATELFGEGCQYIKELYWRDFYTHVAYHYPKVFGDAFQEKYNDIKWPGTEKEFLAWCEGKTGFPIVDAGMRELNQSGYMHNRVRMIVASFLTKDLHIDWRKGERYFAQKLVDYDPAVNNGSWQWAASTGTDAQPYFRVFNPWLQQKKFDPKAEYIKKWVPELKDLDADTIHNLDTKAGPKNYPEPIVDHKTAREIALSLFKIEN